MSTSARCVPRNFTAVPLPGLWGWEGWYVLVCLVLMFVVLLKDWMRTEFAIVLCTLFIWSAQIITTNQALAGFSNSGVLTVATLYIVAEGLSATGGVDYFMGKLMGKPRTLGKLVIRTIISI
jgi:hypothetical protein